MQIIKEDTYQYTDVSLARVDEPSSFTLEKTTPYMLRRDGVLFQCGDVHPYIKVYVKADWRTNLNELNKHPHWIAWYKEHSLNPAVIGLFDRLAEQPTEELYNEINNILNNEFCKVRTTNIKYKYGADNGEIYFRICSTGINWFEPIWQTVANFADKIKYVTIVRDYQTFGSQFDYCTYKQHIFNKMPVQEFLTLEGNPILENKNNKNYLTEF